MTDRTEREHAERVAATAVTLVNHLWGRDMPVGVETNRLCKQVLEDVNEYWRVVDTTSSRS